MAHIDQNGLYDIYSVWHIPFWQTKWFFWSIASIALTASLILIWRIYRWYKLKNQKLVMPWEKAIQQIISLQKQKYPTKESGKQCYFVLTSTLKNYLQERYQFPLSSKTDEEATAYISDQSLNEHVKKDLQGIFQGCLLIKFANEQAMEEQIRIHLEQALAFIKDSIPQE